MKSGIELIAEKRAKHESKGWTSKHDQLHRHGELALVAARLIIIGTDAKITCQDGIPDWGLDQRQDIDRLAIAGSLIAAEIDRLIDRQNA